MKIKHLALKVLAQASRRSSSFSYLQLLPAYNQTVGSLALPYLHEKQLYAFFLQLQANYNPRTLEEWTEAVQRQLGTKENKKTRLSKKKEKNGKAKVYRPFAMEYEEWEGGSMSIQKYSEDEVEEHNSALARRLNHFNILAKMFMSLKGNMEVRYQYYEKYLKIKLLHQSYMKKQLLIMAINHTTHQQRLATLSSHFHSSHLLAKGRRGLCMPMKEKLARLKQQISGSEMCRIFMKQVAGEKQIRYHEDDEVDKKLTRKALQSLQTYFGSIRHYGKQLLQYLHKARLQSALHRFRLFVTDRQNSRAHIHSLHTFISIQATRHLIHALSRNATRRRSARQRQECQYGKIRVFTLRSRLKWWLKILCEQKKKLLRMQKLVRKWMRLSVRVCFEGLNQNKKQFEICASVQKVHLVLQKLSQRQTIRLLLYFALLSRADQFYKTARQSCFFRALQMTLTQHKQQAASKRHTTLSHCFQRWRDYQTLSAQLYPFQSFLHRQWLVKFFNLITQNSIQKFNFDRAVRFHQRHTKLFVIKRLETNRMENGGRKKKLGCYLNGVGEYEKKRLKEGWNCMLESAKEMKEMEAKSFRDQQARISRRAIRTIKQFCNALSVARQKQQLATSICIKSFKRDALSSLTTSHSHTTYYRQLTSQLSHTLHQYNCQFLANQLRICSARYKTNQGNDLKRILLSRFLAFRTLKNNYRARVSRAMELEGKFVQVLRKVFWMRVVSGLERRIVMEKLVETADLCRAENLLRKGMMGLSMRQIILTQDD